MKRIQKNYIGFSYPKLDWPLLSQGPPQKMDQSVNVPGKNHILVFCLELNLFFTHGHITKYVCLAFSYLAQIGQFLAPADR